MERVGRESRGAGRPFRTATVPGLLLVLSAAHPVLALDPSRATTQYLRSSFTQEQGLPQNTVNAIAQTPDGYLWIGTEEGLVRFDGVTFTVFDRKTTPEIRNSFVMGLAVDPSGALWVGTFGGGLLRYRSGRFELFTKEHGLTSERIRSLAVDSRGHLFVSTGGGGVLEYDGARFTATTTKHGLPSDRVWSVVEDASGRHLVGTYGGGLGVLEKGRFTPIPLGPSAASLLVRPLCRDAAGDVWVGTDGAGLFRVRGDAVEAVGADGSLPSPAVRALWPDRDGNLWVGTDGAGLFRYRDGRFSRFSTREGLANDFVLALFEDREGSLWVGTSGGGLSRLRDGKLTTLTTREGLSHDVVRAVLEDRAGNLWAATTGGGVTRFAGGKATVLRAADGLTSDLAFALHEDRAGRLFVGTDGGGVTVLEGGKLRRLTTAEGLANDRVRAIASDRDGAVWFGTVSGLSRWAGGRFTTFTPADGLAGTSVRALLAGRDGSLFIGTDGGGLSRFRDGSFTSWRSAEGLTSLRVFSLHEDERGVLWIGTSGGGLNRLEGGKLTAVTSAAGLFDDVVFQILPDRAGSLWMTCNRGVFRALRKDLDDVAAGRLPRVACQSLGTADGMRSAECNGGSPAGIATRDGRLLIPTIHGIAVIDPARMPRNELPPPVHVEGFFADGKPLGTAGELRLPPGSQQLEIRYTAPSLVVPERVRFRYRLEGYDRSVVDAGTRRAAFYTALPHGRYRFKVTACNNDGVWNEVGAALAFTIAPFFYQTPWFLALGVAAAVASGLGLHRLRMRQVERRGLELERLVTDRTRELARRSQELQKAQEQIERLSTTSSSVLEDPAAWARSVAREMARSVGAREIGIWVIEGDTLHPLASSGLRAPDWREMREAIRDDGILVRDADLVVPVLGMTGETRGAVVVAGTGAGWGDVQKRVVASLARHLGTALDLRLMKERLATSETARRADRDELRRKGVHLAAICPACREVSSDEVPACPHDGATPDWSRLLPLRLADRYRLLRLLGEGGMGTVFQARDEKLARDVVVKVIRPEKLRDPGARLRFEREARLVAHIQHPSVVAVFDTGPLDDGSAFLVMEYLPGLSLAEVLGAFGRGAPAQVARLARQVGGALEAAHAAGIVHRDVKPGNVFLVPGQGGFEAKILDFGVAKPPQTEAQLTRTGIIVGTPAYMAPEQVRGEAVDARSDLYSLAAVLHEALSGKRLVSDADLSRVFRDVLHGAPEALSLLVPGMPPSVDAVFERALAKDPVARPATVREWVEELAPLLEGLTAPEGSGHGWPDAIPRSRREAARRT